MCEDKQIYCYQTVNLCFFFFFPWSIGQHPAFPVQLFFELHLIS